MFSGIASTMLKLYLEGTVGMFLYMKISDEFDVDIYVPVLKFQTSWSWNCLQVPSQCDKSSIITGIDIEQGWTYYYVLPVQAS